MSGRERAAWAVSSVLAASVFAHAEGDFGFHLELQGCG